MPTSPDYRPAQAFAALGPEFADPVAPADFPKAIVRHRNQRAAATVGLGDLTEAERLCRVIVASDPGHFDALHLLGVLCQRGGAPAQAMVTLQPHAGPVVQGGDG